MLGNRASTACTNSAFNKISNSLLDKYPRQFLASVTTVCATGGGTNSSCHFSTSSTQLRPSKSESHAATKQRLEGMQVVALHDEVARVGRPARQRRIGLQQAKRHFLVVA